MAQLQASRSYEFYRSLPKIELHRHLEGSLRLGTLLEIGRAHGIDLPNTNKLSELVQIREGEDFTFENFLSKFQMLRLFYRSPEVIERITMEAIEDAANDNVCYIELRFTPVALGRSEGFRLDEVIDWVITGTQKAEKEFGVKTKLIASVNRHESLDEAMKVAEIAIDRKDDGLVGLDLAGNEAEFDGLNFLGVFKKAKHAGLCITIHAGEWGPAENVSNALLYLYADRIGHGVRIMEDPQAIDLARARAVPMEVCITSNYQSGVVPALTVHPVTRMLENNLNVTINTDDPSISKIQLCDEYRLLCEDLGLPLQTLRECILSAASAAFLPENERQSLINQIKEKFSLAIQS